jgi:hypothetical protein
VVGYEKRTTVQPAFPDGQLTWVGLGAGGGCGGAVGVVSVGSGALGSVLVSVGMTVGFVARTVPCADSSSFVK